MGKMDLAPPFPFYPLDLPLEATPPCTTCRCANSKPWIIVASRCRCCNHSESESLNHFFSIRKWPGLFGNVSGKFSDCHLYIVMSPKCYVFGCQKCPEHLNMAYAEQQWQRMLFGKFGLVGAVLRLMVQRWTHALFF